MLLGLQPYYDVDNPDLVRFFEVVNPQTGANVDFILNCSARHPPGHEHYGKWYTKVNGKDCYFAKFTEAKKALEEATSTLN